MSEANEMFSKYHNAQADPKQTKNLYSHLEVNKPIRTGLWIAILITFFLISNYIFFHIYLDVSWEKTTIPIIIIASFLLIYPPSEYWVYKPWQQSTRKIEHHYLDKEY